MSFGRAPRCAAETPRPSTPRPSSPHPSTPCVATPRATPVTSVRTTSHSTSQSKLTRKLTVARPAAKLSERAATSDESSELRSCQLRFAQLGLLPAVAAARVPIGATLADTLPADALEHLASVADGWDFLLLSHCACVSWAWHAAFARRLRSMPARLREAIQVLAHGARICTPLPFGQNR